LEFFLLFDLEEDEWIKIMIAINNFFMLSSQHTPSCDPTFFSASFDLPRDKWYRRKKKKKEHKT